MGLSKVPLILTKEAIDVLRRILMVFGAVLVVVAGGLFYVRSNPIAVVPAAIHAEGSQLLNPLLRQHPIKLGAGSNNPAVPVSVGHAVRNKSLATSIGLALADQTPTHFAITQADLASVPAAARPLTTKLAGMHGSVTGLVVQSLSGSPLRGQATVSATIDLNGRPYQVTGVLTISNGAITGVSHLTMTAP